MCFVSSYAYGFLKPSSGLPIGGAEVQVCTLARELARDPRFRVSILTANGDAESRERLDSISVVTSPVWGARPSDSAPARQVPRSRRILASVRAVLTESVRLTGVVLTIVGVYRPPPPRSRTWVDDEIDRWESALRRVGADVYVFRCASAHVGFAQAACRRLAKRFVYMIAHDDELAGTGVAVKQDDWFQQGLRLADMVVCQHAAQLREFSRRYTTPAVRIPSILPFAIGGPPAASRSTILWIARIDDWKRPEAFVELAKRMPEERFVMVGPRSSASTDKASLIQDIAELANLEWMERVPFARTYDLFDDAKLFVNTSVSEGFPNTFLQAAARGAPIVSWTVDPDGILERFDIGYCARENWDLMVARVRVLATDEAARERLGCNGRRYVAAHHEAALVASVYARLFIQMTGRGAAAALPASVLE